MAIISSVCLFIIGVIGAAIARVLAEDFKEWTPFFVDKLIRLALSKLPAEHRERFAEEWRSHVNDVPGQIAKLWVAVGFNLAALTIADSRLKAVYFGLKRKLSTADSFLYRAIVSTVTGAAVSETIHLISTPAARNWLYLMAVVVVGNVLGVELVLVAWKKYASLKLKDSKAGLKEPPEKLQ
jgi:hypothetical protein